MASRIPIAEGLFTWPSDVTAPDRRDVQGVRYDDLSSAGVVPEVHGPGDRGQAPPRREGRLWTFTVQGFRPKPPYIGPDEFDPVRRRLRRTSAARSWSNPG